MSLKDQRVSFPQAAAILSGRGGGDDTEGPDTRSMERASRIAGYCEHVSSWDR